MLKRFLSRLFFSGCALAMLVSCGGGDAQLGGGIGEFTTVQASAVASTNRLESDVVTGNTCSATGSAGGTIVTDSVDVTVASRALFPSGALNLLVTKITVHYEPANTRAPRLPDYFITTRQEIPPGGSLAIPVAVVRDQCKIDLLTDTSLSDNLDLCSGEIFEYYVTVTFEISEPGGNGSVKSVSTSLNVAIADRAS